MKVILSMGSAGFRLSDAVMQKLGITRSYWLANRKQYRTDSRIISMLEEFGAEFVGAPNADLEIVDIPDEATEWHVGADHPENVAYVVGTVVQYAYGSRKNIAESKTFKMAARLDGTRFTMPSEVEDVLGDIDSEDLEGRCDPRLIAWIEQHNANLPAGKESKWGFIEIPVDATDWAVTSYYSEMDTAIYETVLYVVNGAVHEADFAR